MHCRGCPRGKGPGSSPASRSAPHPPSCALQPRHPAPRGSEGRRRAPAQCLRQNGHTGPHGVGLRSDPRAQLDAEVWHPLSAIEWEGGEDDILLHRHPAVEGMAPILKLMLLSDGSVTRHLQLLLEDRVMVDSVQTTVPEQASSNVPAAALSIPGPLVQRQVLLRVPSTPPLVYAASWWNASAFSSGVIDATKPVGASLREGKLETYREILRVFKGESDVVGDLLGAEGPFWGRQYLLWHKGAPLTCIYEVFSCALQKQLCPSTVVNLGSRRNGANGRNGVTRTATSE